MEAPSTADRGDWARRVILGAVTALIVARPLVAGEDPGRLHTPESISGIVLNLLWMITAILGAIWFARSPRTSPIRWTIPAGLAAVAILVGVGGAVTHCYHHPAWLIFWEWAALPLIFLLTREIGSDADPADDSAGGLLAAMLASAVSLAAFGVYQTAANAIGLPNPEATIRSAPATGIETDYLGRSAATTVREICTGTFDHSETLIAVLLLTAPAIVAFGLRDRSWRSRVGLALALVMILGLVFGFYGIVSPAIERNNAGWKTAVAMIQEHSLLGVGAGNFDRHSPQLQPAGYPKVLSEPGSAWLELTATSGVPVLIALMIIVAIAVTRIARRSEETAPADSADISSERTPRWEFYLGGVFGLLLGLFLHLIDLPASDAPLSGAGIIAAAVSRALIWFLAFALFEAVAWRTAARRRSLLAGLILVLMFGFVSGSVLLPAISQWFWALAGIALSGEVGVNHTVARKPLMRWAAVPALSTIPVAFFALVCSPICDSAMAMAEARRQARQYPRFLDAAKTATSGLEKKRRSQDAVNQIDKKIHKALSAAIAADRFDIAPELEWAEWFSELWKMVPNASQEIGIAHARRAQELDPQGAEALIREFQLRLLFAGLDTRHFRPEDRPDLKFVERVTQLRKENFDEAMRLIDQISERDPALEARLRFRLAQALVNVNEPVRYEQGLAEAAKVLQLAERAPGPRWQLPRDQLKQVRHWLKLFNDDEIVWPIIWPSTNGPSCVPIGPPSAIRNMLDRQKG